MQKRPATKTIYKQAICAGKKTFIHIVTHFPPVVLHEKYHGLAQESRSLHSLRNPARLHFLPISSRAIRRLISLQCNLCGLSKIFFNSRPYAQNVLSKPPHNWRIFLKCLHLQIFRDKFADREISDIILLCIFCVFGCKWKGRLYHREVCNKRTSNKTCKRTCKQTKTFVNRVDHSINYAKTYINKQILK